MFVLQRSRWDGERLDRQAAFEVFGADEVYYSNEVGWDKRRMWFSMRVTTLCGVGQKQDPKQRRDVGVCVMITNATGGHAAGAARKVLEWKRVDKVMHTCVQKRVLQPYSTRSFTELDVTLFTPCSTSVRSACVTRKGPG